MQLQGFVLELVTKVERCFLQCLIDSVAKWNFISYGVIAAHNLAVGYDGSTIPINKADESVVQAGGWVKSVLLCERCSNHISPRVFPVLHKEIVLKPPRLVQANPNTEGEKSTSLPEQMIHFVANSYASQKGSQY